MESFIKALIYIHAAFGGIGLIAGIVILFGKKGTTLHKRLGKTFYISMGISSLISLVIARMPRHENLFLFLIGIFTIYMLIVGKNALTFKTKSKASRVDWIVSIIMGIVSLLMVLIGIYSMAKGVNNGVLFLFFGLFGLLMVRTDLRFYKDPSKKVKGWLINHIGKMMGALIASVTAFIVAGLNISNTISWMAPSIIGTVYIVYWVRKVKPKEKILPV